jgi:hypothetical protein
MRSWFSWVFLLPIACAVAVGTAFSFGASGLLVARTISLVGTIDSRVAWAAILLGAIGALGTPTSAALWMAAAVRALTRYTRIA